MEERGGRGRRDEEHSTREAKNRATEVLRGAVSYSEVTEREK